MSKLIQNWSSCDAARCGTGSTETASGRTPRRGK